MNSHTLTPWRASSPSVGLWCHRLVAVFVAAVSLTSTYGADSTPPQITLVQPVTGARFEAPATVALEAVTIDLDGYAADVEFLADGIVIGKSNIRFIRKPDPGQPIQHSFTWENVPAGTYRLGARTTDDSGLPGMSAEVLIDVASPPATESPVIAGVELRKGKAIVHGRIPAGLRKVTLESRTRLGTGTWVPRSVLRLDGTGGDIEMELPIGPQHEMLRLRADASEPLPASFYEGTNRFNGQLGSTGDAWPMVLAGGAEDANKRFDTATSAPPTNREVVESDIWQIRGETLYFFNQYRGLQVIDLANPNQPVVRGTLPLPAGGEQMYVLTSGHAVLLVRDNCAYGTDVQSQIVIVDTKETPFVVAKLPVSGTIQESRLVGEALYVASQTYRPIEGSKDGSWEWGTVVTSFDLANPTAPAKRQTQWYPGYGHVITATDRYLFVAIRDVRWEGPSRVQCIDISSPDGTMEARGVVTPAGQVKDKFKMNLEGDVFSVISEQWITSSNRWTTVTQVETFSMADPASPRRLGQLPLAHGEQLYATRFADKRVYVVTFLRIDPLWIVDLSDPANPTISGELEIPGWSTFMQPWGDRLVTVGIDNTNGWRVAVQLFDVSDVRKPTLLSKVPLGENHSWSEANSDEKAFTMLPEAGLILLPYQGHTTNGFASKVQLIDLTKDTLTARGAIEHQMSPRRATALGNRIVSISGRELLTVDAADRDRPAVVHTLELSWQVNRVWNVGSYLLEINDGNQWMATDPVLHLVKTDAADEVISRHALPAGLPVVGAVRKEDRLYVLQGKPREILWTWLEKEQISQPTSTNEGRLILSIFNLAELPALNLLGRTETSTAAEWGYYGDLKPLWPKAGLLVWSSQGGGWWYRGPMLFDEVAGVGLGRIAPWYGGQGGRLLAFDVTNAAAPRWMSETLVGAGWNSWNYGEAFAADGLVFLSHQTNEFIEGLLLPDQKRPEPVVTVNADGIKETNQPPFGVWMQRYFLDVVDFADAANPTIRPPANIPGSLKGIARNGALIYTQGSHWNDRGETDGSEWIDASAYDGVQASLIRSLALPKEWPHPVAIRDDILFIGRPSANTTTGTLEQWQLTSSGDFVTLSKFPLTEAAQGIYLLDGWLAVQRNRGLDVLSVDNPSLPVWLGSAEIAGCVWPDFTKLTGSPTSGFWLPLGDYGVLPLTLKQP